MDQQSKRTFILFGVASLAATAAAQAAPIGKDPRITYRGLLEPFPNAEAALKADDGALHEEKQQLAKKKHKHHHHHSHHHHHHHHHSHHHHHHPFG